LASLAEFLASAQTDGGSPAATVDDRDMLFEPGAAEVLEALIPFYVNRHVYQLVLSARASEHSARMVAMKTAKDNATKLLGDLTLEYNKARQAAITAEILEISAAQVATS
jgi:F-type H+-transporting ATPase subunit gamma